MLMQSLVLDLYSYLGPNLEEEIIRESLDLSEDKLGKKLHKILLKVLSLRYGWIWFHVKTLSACSLEGTDSASM